MKIDYTEEKLREVVLNSETYNQVLISFKRNNSSSSYKVLHKYIKKWEIDTSHFLTSSQVAKKLFNEGILKKTENIDLFIENSTCARSCVKKRIIDENIIDYKCFKCGNEGEWMGEKITLILDHKNGINNDNRIENLRFACPNCNSTLETHCQGSKVFKTKQPKLDKRTLKHDRVESRKIEWPTKEVLMELLENMSYVSIGKKYGVSDNAVRKWSKKYNII
jgi:5-methylcytosine-specific restriction endonuclease McrA